MNIHAMFIIMSLHYVFSHSFTLYRVNVTSVSEVAVLSNIVTKSRKASAAQLVSTEAFYISTLHSHKYEH